MPIESYGLTPRFEEKELSDPEQPQGPGTLEHNATGNTEVTNDDEAQNIGKQLQKLRLGLVLRWVLTLRGETPER